MALLNFRVDHYFHFDAEPCREKDLNIRPGKPERIPTDMSTPLIVPPFAANQRVPLNAENAILTDGSAAPLPNPVTYTSPDGALLFTAGTDSNGVAVTFVQVANGAAGDFVGIASDGVVTDKQIHCTVTAVPATEDDINIVAGAPEPIPAP